MCLLSGSVRGPRLLPVQDPTRLAAAFSALGLESHRRGVGAGVGLAVADRELDVVAQDLREELLLHLLAGFFDQGLADDADALADLRATTRRELLVEEVLVHALALGTAVLLGPRESEPAPLTQLGHERPALGRVDDLRHVLAGQIEDVGIVVFVEEADDLLFEGALLGREIEVHGRIVREAPRRMPSRTAVRR